MQKLVYTVRQDWETKDKKKTTKNNSDVTEMMQSQKCNAPPN